MSGNRPELDLPQEKSRQSDDAAPTFDAIELMKQKAPETVRIHSWTTLGYVIPTVERGSGFFLDVGDPRKCVVATDSHVAKVLPTVYLNDGSSHSARVVKTNDKNEMTYLELDGVPNPEKQCKGVSISDSDNFNEKEPIVIVDKRGGKLNLLQGESIPIGLLQVPFRNGLFADSITLTAAAYRVDGAGPGLSGMPLFTMEGKVKSVVVGGNERVLFAKPMDSIRQDNAELKEHYKKRD